MAGKSAIVIGAGIVGLSMARALVTRDYRVTVIERNMRAIGASIRNFGMIWPIGQPEGHLFNRALLSQQIWKKICDEAGIWYEQKGSLHLAYEQDELTVLEEIQELYRNRGYRMLSGNEIIAKSPAVVQNRLLGGLFSNDEMVVNPKETMSRMPEWLSEKYKVEFVWGNVVTGIRYPAVHFGNKSIRADEIYVCSGQDFETLYPDLFVSAPLTRCKLQMIRLVAQPEGWRIGPSLCGALSLLHYSSFGISPSLKFLRQRLEENYPEHIKWGIHVMVSQNQQGELTIGDSHEYGSLHDPFDKNLVNQYILQYLQSFARFKTNEILETWNGIYAKMTDGSSGWIHHPEPGVTLINGLGGAGMTLSFGLCEEYARSL